MCHIGNTALYQTDLVEHLCVKLELNRMKLLSGNVSHIATVGSLGQASILEGNNDPYLAQSDRQRHVKEVIAHTEISRMSQVMEIADQYRVRNSSREFMLVANSLKKHVEI